MPDPAHAVAFHRIGWAIASLAAAAAALFIAAHHPLWPLALSALLAVWAVLAYRWPRAWLLALPALLPGLNFAPWTGWIGVDELDLFILATVAAGYAGFAKSAGPRPMPLSGPGRLAVMGVLALTLSGLWRGVTDAGGWHFGWFQGYTEPLNSLRVAKSAIHALLLLPLLRREWLVDRERAFTLFEIGRASCRERV